MAFSDAEVKVAMTIAVMSLVRVGFKMVPIAVGCRSWVPTKNYGNWLPSHPGWVPPRQFLES